jgi:hypothetical protein
MALIVSSVAILVFQVIGIARQAAVDSIGSGKNRVVAIIECVGPGVRSVEFVSITTTFGYLHLKGIVVAHAAGRLFQESEKMLFPEPSIGSNP